MLVVPSLFVETAAKTLAASGTLRTAGTDTTGPFPLVGANTVEDWFGVTNVIALLDGTELMIDWEDPWSWLGGARGP